MSVGGGRSQQGVPWTGSEPLAHGFHRRGGQSQELSTVFSCPFILDKVP